MNEPEVGNGDGAHVRFAEQAVTDSGKTLRNQSSL